MGRTSYPVHMARKRLRIGRKHLPEGVLCVAVDRLRRTVHVTEDTMRHIVKGHPEMDGCEQAIKAAIESAYDRYRGRVDGRIVEDREVLYGQNLGPMPRCWLKVVVRYDLTPAEVVTAFPSRTGPEEEDKI